MEQAKLFPSTLIRVSGGPFDRFEKLNFTESIIGVKSLIQLNHDIQGLRQKLCDNIYGIIQTCQGDTEVQNGLLNLKRDLFNDRNIAPGKYDVLLSKLPDNLRSDVDRLFGLKKERSLRFQDGEISYQTEMIRLRNELKFIISDDLFEKGLLLSSQDFLDRIHDYCKIETANLKKKETRIEEGLIKYLSRMYAKTSPFSTYTNLCLGRISETNSVPGGSVIIEKDDDGIEVISHLRLNNFLFKYLRTLFFKNPDIYRRLLLRPNPTIRKLDNQYHFLTNSNNIEAFQRINENPVVEVFRILTSEKSEGIIYKDLVKNIIDNEYIDAGGEDIEAFINQLIDFGFLEYNLGVSGIDPDWDMKLRRQLEPMGSQYLLIQELADVLGQLREMAKEYETGTVIDRKRILSDAFQLFRQCCMKLHEAAGLPAEERLPIEEYRALKKKEYEEQKKQAEEKKDDSVEPEKDEVFKHFGQTVFDFKPEQMFYEDTSLNMTPTLSEQELTPRIMSLNKLLSRLELFNGRADEKELMSRYFIDKYGKDSSVELLAYYEDYYKDVKKPEAEKADKLKKERQKQLAEKAEKAPVEQNPSEEKKDLIPEVNKDHPDDTAKRELRKLWTNQLQSSIRVIPGQEVVDITADQIEALKFSTEEIKCNNHKNTSYGAFIQFFKNGNENSQKSLMAVSNGTMSGFGKMFSRFLHIFDTSVTEEIRAWNTTVEPESMMIEDCDASYFNANLHPPLMPFEIWMPSGHNTLPEKQQIPVTDLLIRFDESEHQLRLYHKPSNKPVYVFDLGFQGHGGRSQLFQLLEKFSLVNYNYYHPVLSAVNHHYTPKRNESGDTKPDNQTPDKRFMPRIVYDGWLILQRKAWYIPKDQLPLIQPKETEWSYFHRVYEWKTKHNLPDDVFVYIMSRQPDDSADPEAMKKLGRDDYKPQYISFNNPFLVSLFEKLVSKTPKEMRIEEMLPHPEHLNTIQGQRHITEFVMQWYVYRQ